MQIILIKGRLEIHIFLAETTPPDQCLSRPVVRVLKHFHVISCSSVSRRISKMLHRTRFSINLQEAWILTTSLPVNNCIDIKQCRCITAWFAAVHKRHNHRRASCCSGDNTDLLPCAEKGATGPVFNNCRLHSHPPLCLNTPSLLPGYGDGSKPIKRKLGGWTSICQLS